MRLGLTSSALPDASLEALLEGCERRGLPELELAEGHAHGISAGEDASITKVRGAAAERGVTFAGYRVGPTGDPRGPAVLAGRLESPLVVDGQGPLEELRRRADELHRVGAEVRVLVRGPDADQDADTLVADGRGVVWEAAADDPGLAERFEALQDAAGGGLAAIRLLGGGPEAAAQEAGGIGALFGRLALRAFQGPVLLAPSSHRFHVAWRDWLERGRGWGCGGAS